MIFLSITLRRSISVQLISSEKMDNDSQLLEEDPSCSVCGEVFSAPVVLCCVFCGCSFCEICSQQFWETQCPFCRKDASGSHLRKFREQRLKVLNTAQLNDKDRMKTASDCTSLPMHENNQYILSSYRITFLFNLIYVLLS